MVWSAFILLWWHPAQAAGRGALAQANGRRPVGQWETQDHGRGCRPPAI